MIYKGYYYSSGNDTGGGGGPLVLSLASNWSLLMLMKSLMSKEVSMFVDLCIFVCICIYVCVYVCIYIYLFCIYVYKDISHTCSIYMFHFVSYVMCYILYAHHPFTDTIQGNLVLYWIW